MIQSTTLASRVWPQAGTNGLVRNIVLAVIGSLIVAAAAQITVPMYPVPMTLQTLAGFAHGFLSLSDETDVLYKTTDYWAPEYERTIAWDDPDLAISWPLTHAPTVADKDRNAPQLSSAETFV